MAQMQELYVAELFGKNVFDPTGDFVGTVSDIVLQLDNIKPSKVYGFVVEVPGKRKVFLPMSRTNTLKHTGIIMSGLLNMRRFTKRNIETLGFTEFLDRIVKYENNTYKIQDFSIVLRIRGEWFVEKLFLRKVEVDKKGREKSGFTKLFTSSGETTFVSLLDVELDSKPKLSTERIVEDIEDMKPADAAEVVLDLDKTRQAEITKEFSVETLADVLEEMDEDDQLKILSTFEDEKIVEVLEEMEPDDAADLLGKMPSRKATQLLGEIDEVVADDLKQLLSYEKNSAGGLMTTNPVIVEADDTVAYALAQIREEELSPSLASVVFIVRAPIDTPTGKFLGVIHFQQLLRIPPHLKVGEYVDTDVPIIHPHFSVDQVARTFATYNSVILPVIDKNMHLVGAISVDDVLDHILPDDWREIEDE
jgi:CBS domain-containing protein/sporulation protein YlmC with PRC-barrel domain